LSGGRNVSVDRIFALHISRPELFPFRRFETFAMRGTLRDGCPFRFWWAGHPSSAREGEIRVLSTPPPDPDPAALQMTPDPQPGWTPTFPGYRHVMSSLIWTGPSYVGLWNRSDATPGSLVATYSTQGAPVTSLGTARWTYDGIYAAPQIHVFMFSLMAAPEQSELLYIATFVQADPHGCCGRSRRQR
jgi:hypothetical protein